MVFCTTSVWQNRIGNSNCPYLNRDGNERNLNLNIRENRWNDNCRFLAFRNSLHSPALPEFFVCTPLVHPPSILPMSFSGAETAAYLVLSSTLSSHEICKKNFRISSFTLARFRNGGFASRDI